MHGVIWMHIKGIEKGAIMAGKLRAIVKRTDEPYGHVCNISGSLENLQKIVGGYIETVPVGAKHVLIVNEEGKLRSLPFNFHMGRYDTIVGDAIVLGVRGEEFTDATLELWMWKELLKEWGN